MSLLRSQAQHLAPRRAAGTAHRRKLKAVKPRRVLNEAIASPSTPRRGQPQPSSRRRLPRSVGWLAATLVCAATLTGPRAATAADTTDFINTIGPLAQQSMAATQVPASVTIAQAILETGWGASSLGQPPYNNMFGIKCSGTSTYSTGCADFSTQEYQGGAWTNVTASFRTYATTADSVADHANFLVVNSRYAPAFAYVNDPDSFARAIATAGYATDPSYATKLISLMTTYQLYDWDIRCDTATGVSALIDSMPTTGCTSGVSGDYSGDGHADILAIHNSGKLYAYTTSSNGVPFAGYVRGWGWQIYNWASKMPDINGDGYDEVIARRSSDGALVLYYGGPNATLTLAGQIGQHWNGLGLITVTPDLTGDGYPDIVGRDATNRLLRYSYVPGVGVMNQTTIGQHWGAIQSLNVVHSSDGIIMSAIGAGGSLNSYWFSDAGTIASQAQVGQGWSGWTLVTSPGDFNGDGLDDLVGRRPDGKLFTYLQGSQGTWGEAQGPSKGWAEMLQIF